MKLIESVLDFFSSDMFGNIVIALAVIGLSFQILRAVL